jgi:hypothetical protein
MLRGAGSGLTAAQAAVTPGRSRNPGPRKPVNRGPIPFVPPPGILS